MVLLVFYILLLLIAFPLGQLSRVPLSLNVDVTLLDIVVGLGGILWIVRQIRTKSVTMNSQTKAFLVFISLLFLSLVLQVFHLPLYQIKEGALYLFRYIVYGSLFFIVFSSSQKVKQFLLRMLLLGGGILLVTGYAQFFLYPSLRNLIYAGWDEHFYRMFGTFLDPNYFGMFLVGYMLLAVSFLLSQKKRNMRFLLGALVLATFIGIVLSYSRTALLALSVGLLVMFWKKVYTKKIIFGICFLFVIGVSVMSVVGRHAEGNDLLRITSTNARIGDAKNALIIFSQNSLFGVGFNTYRFAQYRYGFMKGSLTQEDHGASGADSSLLFVMATSGIVGAVAFLYFLYIHFHHVKKQKNRLGLSTLLAFFVGSFFVNILFYPSLLVWLWIVLGVSENTSQ